MAATALALVVLSSVIRHAGPLEVVSTVPFGVLAHRHRLRAATAAAAACALLTFLIVGFGGASSTVVYAVVGIVVGITRRRGTNPGVLVALATAMGLAAGGVADLLLWVLTSYRDLTFRTVQASVDGSARVVAGVPVAGPLMHWVQTVTATLLRDWAVGLPVALVLVAPVLVLASRWLIGAVLGRLDWVESSRSVASVPATEDDTAAPAPLPMDLSGVTVTYPGADRSALGPLDLTLVAGEFVVVVGDNGSGKSTLAHVLAGVPPTSGTVRRPGPIGLGVLGGTALIGQRPDAQVLGTRVSEDVTWGLPDGHDVDVAALLERVGLTGTEHRNTASLSGGQLQRLALAAALARRPSLLISDEATAMIDPQGRAELVAMLAALPRDTGTTVVHVTHSEAEAALADRVVRLHRGRAVPERVRPARAEAVTDRTVAAGIPLTQQPVLELRDVAHTYAAGSPWAKPALHGVNLSLRAGEGLLVTGGNGSGKSTLSWVMAGLTVPTEGRCVVLDHPVSPARGEVALAFQYPRLQVQRPTVGADICDAAGWPWKSGRRAHLPTPEQDARIAAALERVGLSAEMATTPVEHLSGGQLRRVALAGLLARGPRVLVLDEPFAGLDGPSREFLVEQLDRLRATGLTLVVVSHETADLSSLLPREIVLDDGRVVEDSDAGPDLSAVLAGGCR